MRFITSTFLASAILVSIGCASKETTSISRGPSMDEINQQIKTLQTNAKMPGLEVLVTQGEQTVFEYTQGVRAVGHSATVHASDKWHIGSCTKPMTAFLIGRLVDQKLLNWNTTLAEIIPKSYKLDPSLKSVTVEQLLSHSSGLADVMAPKEGKLWPTIFTDKQSSQKMRDTLVRGILELPVRFQPGSQFEYSNSGYVVLGWIIERKKKSSWETVAKKDLFEKLGMNSCGFGPAGVQNKTTPLQPWPHILESDQVKAVTPGIGADNPPALGPAGTVHCSASDWHKFLKLLSNDEGVRSGYLSSATYNKLLSSAGSGPFTYSSFGKIERTWSKGPVFVMAGSNTMNYAVVAVAPNLNRIFTFNTNLGGAAVEEASTQVLKLLTEIK